jgi:hypothetical protein
MFAWPSKRNALALGGLAALLLGISLVLTIAGSAKVGSHDSTRGQIWAIERVTLMKRPTLDEINRQIGSDGKRVTDDGETAYVWHDVALRGVVLTGRFAEDGRLSYFRRESHPQWRTDTATYSLREKKWDYSETR